jgi:proteasome lid subunit RPN8/RPN11
VILIPRPVLKALADAAEAAYPDEACGLLVGRLRGNGEVVVSRAELSPNVADGDRSRRFEVDPVLRIRLMKELRGGDERIVGHFHSHPGHAAQPSAADLARAFEPELVWVITSVEGGQAVHTTAHVVDDSVRQFREIPLRTADWQPYPLQSGLFEDNEKR